MSGPIAAPSGSTRYRGREHLYLFPPHGPNLRGDFPTSTPAVLIVDDEKNILLTLGMALENLSISVDTADTGAAALDKLAAGSYDLLLLDLRLHDLDGMEILRWISQTRP
jgi:response regulator RpfG family c-di-GMP phosphodiesterase